MTLTELLNLKNPTVEQYTEAETMLMGIARESKAEIDRLDAEGRSRAADRLQGKDDGGEARATARAVAEQRKTDAELTLSDIRSKRATLECQIAKAADEAAWAKVRKALNERRNVMAKIEELLQQAASLNSVQQECWQTANDSAPVKIGRDEAPSLVGFGRTPIESGIAMLARFHLLLGVPARVQRTNIDEMMMHERRVNQGLVEFLRSTEKALLKSE